MKLFYLYYYYYYYYYYFYFFNTVYILGFKLLPESYQDPRVVEFDVIYSLRAKTLLEMCAMPISAVFCISLILGDPGRVESLRLKSFPTVPSAPTTIGTTFVFIFLISLFADRGICKFSQMFSTLCWCLMVLKYQPEYTLFFFHLQPLCLVYLPVCFCLCVLGCPIVLLVRLFLSLVEFRVRTTYF